MENKQRKRRQSQGTEPDLGGPGGQEPAALKCAFFKHPDDEEIYFSDSAKLIGTKEAPPDGKTTLTCEVKVTDQNQEPVPGAIVQFTLNYNRPGGNWRSAGGMKKLYDKKKGNGNRAKDLVDKGVIRVIGSLSANSAKTDTNGIARVVYRTSHIASDFNQRERAREQVDVSVGNVRDSLNINVGWTGLKKIQIVSGGLRVIGATGRYVHPGVHEFLKKLGAEVKNAKWPHPVTVTAASLRWGGQYPPHFTHKHGLTLDLRPMSTDGKSTWAKENGKSEPNYDSDRTKILIAVLKGSNGTVYFNGKDAGGTSMKGHDNHIHVSWLPSTNIRAGDVTI